MNIVNITMNMTTGIIMCIVLIEISMASGIVVTGAVECAGMRAHACACGGGRAA